MSIVSIRLSNELLQEVDVMAKALHIARTEYIRKAIEQMNEKTLELKRKQNLVQASLKVRKNSMDINAEFSRIEHDPED